MTADMINEGIVDTFFTVLGVLVTGLAAGFTVVGVFIYKPVEEEEARYEEKYREEFEELEEKELDDDTVKSLCEKYLSEETPNGEVVMCYDKDNESYNYWCDDKSIKFLTLDAVAHKYAIENDCRALCVNYKDEYEKAREKVLKHIEEKKKKDEKKEEIEEEESVKKSVFAKFKSYNTVNDEVAADDKNKESIQVEKCNKFKYKGKLQDWKEMQEKKGKNEEKDETTMSVSEWLRRKNANILEKREENIKLNTKDKNEEERKKEK